MIYVEKYGKGLRRLSRTPRYVAAHRVTGLRGDGAREWDEPEMVWGHGGHRPVRGKVDIRPVPESYAADLEQIDAERKQLRERLARLDADERQILELAWSISKPLTLTEVKDMIPAAPGRSEGRP